MARRTGERAPAVRRMTAWLPVGALMLAGCQSYGVDPSKMEIVEDVAPLAPLTLRKLCLEVNTDVKEAFTDSVFEALRSLDFSTQSRQSAFGDECRYWMRYHATWAGFPEYLATAEFRVYDGRRELGHAVYDARQGGSRLDRYGSSADKVKPLLEAMFLRVDRGTGDGRQEADAGG